MQERMHDTAKEGKSSLSRSAGRRMQHTENRPTPIEPGAHRQVLGMQRHLGNRRVQRLLQPAREGNSATEVSTEVEEGIHHARGGGQAMDPAVMSQMEQALGADFRGVRVHTGADAHRLNQAIHARAFTTGQDIFFRQGEYSPGSSAGRRLIAHELTHVVQQAGAPVRRQLTVGPPDDIYEQEADRMAEAVVQREPHPETQRSPGLRVQRQAAPATTAGAPQTETAAPIPTTHPLYPFYVANNFDLAAVVVANKWGEGGITSRQKAAVNAFAGPGGAGGPEAPPAMSEQLMRAGISFLLDKALGQIGDLVKEAMKAREVAALVQEIVNSAVSAATGAISQGVNAALSGGGQALATPLATFQNTQITTLDAMAQREYETTLQRLAGVSGTQRWVVARELYDALQSRLQEAYNVQWDQCTDQWFTMQNRALRLPSVYQAGVLYIRMTNDVYPSGDDSALGVSSSQIVGAGSNSSTWARLNDRPLRQIGIPKYLVMRSANMGMGILDVMWTIYVHGGIDRGPMITVPGGGPSPFTGGEQRPQDVNGNRWAAAWFAAKALGLRDLDNDDPRVTDANVARGVNMVWDAVKDRTLASFGARIEPASFWS